MGKFVSYRFKDMDLTLKEWFLYTYIVNLAWHKDSNDGSIRRGQAKFRLREVSGILAKSTADEILSRLVNKGLIHKGYYRNCGSLGALLTVVDYDLVNKITPDGSGQDTGQTPDSEASVNKEETSISETVSGLSFLESRNSLFENVEILNNNKGSAEGETPSAKTRQRKPKSEMPTWVASIYMSKLAEHFNQTIEKVDSGDKKQLEKLFKAVTDEEKMSKLFTYYFTLKDDYYLSRGFPLGLLVKNQATFFRAIGNSTHTKITERRF